MIGLGNSVVKRKLAGASVPAAPINIVQPSLSGSGAVGEAVICNRGTWSGSPTPTYTYDFRLDSVSVQNSTSNSYTPLLADDGKTLTCLVTATNSQGSASEGTSNSIVIGIAPSNTIAPTLSPSGTQSTGTVITVDNGTFTGTAPLTYAYRWKRNGSIILGETANTYTLVVGDDGTLITAEVKAINAYGESAYICTSNQVDAVNPIAPSNVIAPVISGSTSLGSVLSTTNGTWSGVPATFSYTYQWKRNGSPIGGATASTYTTVVADSLANITCDVTADNGVAPTATEGSTTLTMANYTPANTIPPAVTGTAVVGQTLSTTNGTWTNSPSTFAYQWYRGATLISGATNSTYTLVQADAGNTSNIKCVVTATNSAGSASADSNTVAQILTVRTNAFITASGISDSIIRGGLNTFDVGLISNSLDTKMKAVYPFVGGTASTHRWNFMDARDLDAAFRLVFSGTWTHSSTGALPNGTNAFANTFLSPSANQTATSGHFSIYSRTAGASSNQFGSNGVRDAIPVRSSSLTIRRQDNSRAATMWGEGANDLVLAGSETDARGFYIASRIANNSLKLYKNANAIGTVTGTQTTTTLSTNFYFLSALNQSGSPLATTYDNKEIAFSSIGAGLTDPEVTIFNELVNGLNTELGRSILVGNAGVIGDSTIASYLGQNSVASYISLTGTMSDISTPGDTINQQLTKWNALSSGVKSAMNYVFVQIGLNDVNPAESSATALGRYQTLINQINTDTSAKIILGTMIPCKERLTDVYGPVNGLISYQKWLDMNEAIKGNGPNAITGADAVATRHTDLLNDGNGNLAPIYEVAGTNDHIHENNAGRIIIAHSWRSKA